MGVFSLYSVIQDDSFLKDVISIKGKKKTASLVHLAVHLKLSCCSQSNYYKGQIKFLIISGN